MLRSALAALAILLVPTAPSSPTVADAADLAPPAVVGPVVAVRYHRPLRAPVVDHFRLADGPYGPGNRGWEYATAPGTPVRVAAAGVVVFAGTVAGERYVSVVHPDGIRSTYSYLASMAVAAGQQVVSGHVVGTTTARFQIGFRRGEVYLDPAGLLGSQVARLVPDGRFATGR